MDGNPKNGDSPLELRLGVAWFVAFIALVFVIHEAHELAHTTTGFFLCGGWGPRDFNVWVLPEGCTGSLATLAGPVLSYALLLCGWRLLVRGGDTARAAGWVLILAANPFARVFTAAMGGGDEGVLVRRWTGLPRGLPATVITLGIVVLICAGPLLAAWHATPRRRRLVLYPVLLLLPMAATGTILFAGLNPLLHAGVLAEPVVAGAPLMVWLVTIVSVVVAVGLGGRLVTTSSEGRA